MQQSFSKRKRIFIGAEGEGERTPANWTNQLCDSMGLRAHLDIRVCGGGDSLAVVAFSVKEYRKRSKEYRKYSSGLILLDEDCIEENRQRGRDPFAGLAGEDLNLIRLVPNLEGLVLRLHPGCENRTVSAQAVKPNLRKEWPEYAKPISALKLGRRFQLQVLQRVAQTDKYIRQTLEILGLPFK